MIYDRNAKDKERRSRDEGREAVRAMKEVPELVEKVKNLIAQGKDKEKDTTFKASEYNVACHELESALFRAGYSVDDAFNYISRAIGRPYISSLGKGRKVAKHSFKSRDEFYAAVKDFDDKMAVMHYGVLGMKWGIRRYQNPDGSLTSLGKKHIDDGKTQKAIDKFNAKKSNAIATGDKKFVEKHLDYLTNDDIEKFNTRLRARNTIASLKKEAEGISADRFKNWLNTASNVVSNAGNLAENGIRLYNSVVKINNTFSSHKLKPINTNPDGDKKSESISETWENGKLTRTQRQYTDENGNRRDVTKTYTDKTNRPETIKNVYDEDGNKKSTSRTYTDEKGNNVTDTHQYKAPEKKSGSSDWADAWKKYADQQEKVLAKADEAANYWQNEKKKKGGKGK